MLSTNVILLAIVIIGLIYLYCNINFREGVTSGTAPEPTWEFANLLLPGGQLAGTPVPIPQAATQFSQVAIVDDNLWVVGGVNPLCYNPDDDPHEGKWGNAGYPPLASTSTSTGTWPVPPQRIPAAQYFSDQNISATSVAIFNLTANWIPVSQISTSSPTFSPQRADSNKIIIPITHTLGLEKVGYSFAYPDPGGWPGEADDLYAHCGYFPAQGSASPTCMDKSMQAAQKGRAFGAAIAGPQNNIYLVGGIKGCGTPFTGAEKAGIDTCGSTGRILPGGDLATLLSATGVVSCNNVKTEEEEEKEESPGGCTYPSCATDAVNPYGLCAEAPAQRFASAYYFGTLGGQTKKSYIFVIGGRTTGSVTCMEIPGDPTKVAGEQTFIGVPNLPFPITDAAAVIVPADPNSPKKGNNVDTLYVIGGSCTGVWNGDMSLTNCDQNNDSCGAHQPTYTGIRDQGTGKAMTATQRSAAMQTDKLWKYYSSGLLALPLEGGPGGGVGQKWVRYTNILLNVPRMAFGAVAINNKIYAIAGATEPNYTPVNYTPIKYAYQQTGGDITGQPFITATPNIVGNGITGSIEILDIGALRKDAASIDIQKGGPVIVPLKLLSERGWQMGTYKNQIAGIKTNKKDWARICSRLAQSGST